MSGQRVAEWDGRATAFGRGRLALFPLLVLALLVPAAARAVTVWPTTVFIDSRTRTATLTLSNTGLRAEEIEIDFSFGIPVADENGSVRVIFLDSAGIEQHSIVEHVRAFPRRMRLEPGQTQIVRLLVQPPEGLPMGEYWGRVMVASIGGQPPIQQQQGNVTMSITVRTVIAVGLYYRHGQVETSLAVTEARAERGDGLVSLYLDMVRGGNAAFLGRAVVDVLDSRGELVTSHTEQLAVHDDMLWRIDVPLPEGMQPGFGYTIRYTVEAVRDGAGEGLLPVDPVTGTVAVPAQ
jgi:P pilus assembly chaperone PapD